jgi:23S rRNA (adenine2503-C2)-methyltransferase
MFGMTEKARIVMKPVDEKPLFLDMAPEDWAAKAVEMGEKPFRGRQISDWIYKHGISDPDQMSNLSINMRQQLKELFHWELASVNSRLDAQDGTTKLLLNGRRQQLIETVVMRYDGRTTLCVSSQVGCRLACSFCQTGKLGFFRSLTQGEILQQLYIANNILESEKRRISNIVFMGMGEPLDNYDHAVGAANVMIDPSGFGLSARHVTLSTSGIAPAIRRLATESRAALAISLHAAEDQLRTDLMPINRRHNLAELREAIIFYQQQTGKKITIEYILIHKKNCGLQQAKQLVRFLQGIPAKVNLIPFNDHPGSPFGKPEADEIRAFQKFLADRSIPAPVRYSRGLEASAACGQLAAKNIDTLHNAPRRKSIISEDLSANNA